MAVLQRRPLASLGCVAVVVLQAIGVAPELTGEASAPRSAERSESSYGVFLLNVHMPYTNHDEVGARIAAEDPDLVLLVEADEAWVTGVEPYMSDYPHRHLAPRGDFLGLAIYSRYPLMERRHSYPGGPEGPMLSARIQGEDGPLWIGLIHALPPVKPSWVESQRMTFDHLSAEQPWGSSPGLLCGDFNATPWSMGVRELRQRAGLLHARAAGWPWGTWPDLGGVGIPIDHCLVTADLPLFAHDVATSAGSDHRPISVELGWRPAARDPSEPAGSGAL